MFNTIQKIILILNLLLKINEKIQKEHKTLYIKKVGEICV